MDCGVSNRSQNGIDDSEHVAHSVEHGQRHPERVAAHHELCLAVVHDCIRLTFRVRLELRQRHVTVSCVSPIGSPLFLIDPD